MLKLIAISYFIIFSTVGNSDELSLWIKNQNQISRVKLQENVSPAGTLPGITVASPSRQDPDYYFHWIRDSALVMDSLLVDSADLELSKPFLSTLDDFLSLSRKLQLTASATGLGEPRFNVDGTPFTGPWARPQNDGPALRALTVMHLLDKHVSPSRQQKISEILETDLMFIISQANQPSFDIWEEIRADHFYTKIVQMAALKKAENHFDPRWKFTIFDCESARAHLHQQLETHWLADKKYFTISKNRIEGGDNKKTDLDTAVILGILHGGLDSETTFSVKDDRVLSTAHELELMFQRIYKINQDLTGQELAPAMGRYEDDVYFGGNPWYLTTLAFAELNYRLAGLLQKNSEFKITLTNQSFLLAAWQNCGRTNPADLPVGLILTSSLPATRTLVNALVRRGDQFMARVRKHTPADGSLAEQFNRNNGYALSARDLTWSYASFLTATSARDQIILKGASTCGLK